MSHRVVINSQEVPESDDEESRPIDFLWDTSFTIYKNTPFFGFKLEELDLYAQRLTNHLRSNAIQETNLETSIDAPGLSRGKGKNERGQVNSLVDFERCNWKYVDLGFSQTNDSNLRICKCITIEFIFASNTKPYIAILLTDSTDIRSTAISAVFPVTLARMPMFVQTAMTHFFASYFDSHSRSMSMNSDALFDDFFQPALDACLDMYSMVRILEVTYTVPQTDLIKKMTFSMGPADFDRIYTR